MKLEGIRTTVKGKVTRAVVAILVLTILILAYSNALTMKNGIEKKQYALMHAQTADCAEKINTIIASEIEMVRSAALSMSSYYEFDKYDAQIVVNQFYTNHSELYSMYVGFSDGQSVRSNRDLVVASDYDPRERIWYKKAIENKGVAIINPYPDIHSGEMCCTISCPIYQNNEIVAVVGADMKIDTVVDYVDSICYDIEAYGFLIDSDGNIVTHKNEAFRPTAEKSYSVSETQPYIIGIIEKPGSEVVEARDYNGEPMYFASAEVGNLGWTLCTAVSTMTVHRQIQRLIAITIAISVILLIIAICYMIVKISRLLKPLEEVVPAMDRLVAGDFTTWLEFTDQNDEIGQLQNSMSMLVSTLSDVVLQQKYVLGEIVKGNLMVNDMDELPGELNDISASVNNIKVSLTEIMGDIKFTAISLQGIAMGIAEAEDTEQMQSLYDELSAQATEMMNKASMYNIGDDVMW